MKNQQKIRTDRRKFLKIAAFGGVAFLAGKFFGPLLNMIKKDSVVDEKVFDNYKITETRSQFKLIDREGDEIIIVDKD